MGFDMTTEATATASGLNAGLWLSIAELAQAKGTTRQNIHKRIERLLSAGLIDVRTEGRSRLVNLAQYDRAIGATGDAAKEAAAETRAMNDADAGAEETSPFREAQTREKQYAADLKFLELQERTGRLVPLDELKADCDELFSALAHALDGIPSFADEVSIAVGKNGPAGASAVLKQVARAIRQDCANALKALATRARAESIDATDRPTTFSQTKPTRTVAP
jgi:biotin operon repressor